MGEYPGIRRVVEVVRRVSGGGTVVAGGARGADGSGSTVPIVMAPHRLPVLGHLVPMLRDPLGFMASLPAHGDLVGIGLGLFSGARVLGNGAAMRMRVAPLGVYFAEDLDRAAGEAALSAHVTHRHPEAIVGAKVVAVAAGHAAVTREKGCAADELMDVGGRPRRLGLTHRSPDRFRMPDPLSSATARVAAHFDGCCSRISALHPHGATHAAQPGTSSSTTRLHPLQEKKSPDMPGDSLMVLGLSQYSK